MSRYQIATDKHRAGFNCCAAVLFAFQDITGLTDEQTYAIASGMGGGLRTGEICGAVSAAVMALGCLMPHDPDTGLDGKERNAAATQALQERFSALQGSTICRALKPRNAYHIPDASVDGAELSACEQYILTAVELLCEMCGIKPIKE